MLLKSTFSHLWIFPFLSVSPSTSLAHQTAIKKTNWLILLQLCNLIAMLTAFGPTKMVILWDSISSLVFLPRLSSFLLQGPLYLLGCLIIKRYFQVRLWVMLYNTKRWKSLKFITQVRCWAALMAHPWQTAWTTSVKKEMWELAVCVYLRKICPRKCSFPRDHCKKDDNYQPDSTVAGELQRLLKYGWSQFECVVHY